MGIIVSHVSLISAKGAAEACSQLFHHVRHLLLPAEYVLVCFLRPCMPHLCSEKIVERSSGLLVCPISGTCSARLLTCAEEDEEEGDRDPEKEHREEDFGGERGEWWN